MGNYTALYSLSTMKTTGYTATKIKVNLNLEHTIPTIPYLKKKVREKIERSVKIIKTCMSNCALLLNGELTP
jgi:hypothetical protein